MKLETLYMAEDWKWGRFGRGVAAGGLAGLSLFGMGKATTRMPAATAVQTQDQDQVDDGLWHIAKDQEPETVDQAPAELDQPQPEAQAPQSQDQSEPFNLRAAIVRLAGYEGGIRTKAYRIGKRGEIDIAMGHAMYNPTLSKPTSASRAIFTKLFGESVDFDKVLRGETELTREQVIKLVVHDVKLHLDRARTVFPKFDSFSQEAKEAALDMVYRGDWKNARAAINAGNFKLAAAKYLNTKERKKAKTNKMGGIITRTNANAAALLKYAKELGQ